jgi:hypothetical protein
MTAAGGSSSQSNTAGQSSWHLDGGGEGGQKWIRLGCSARIVRAAGMVLSVRDACANGAASPGARWHLSAADALVNGHVTANGQARRPPNLPSHRRSRPAARWPFACGTSGWQGCVVTDVDVVKKLRGGGRQAWRPRRVGARSRRGARDGDGFPRALLVVRGWGHLGCRRPRRGRSAASMDVVV